MNKAQLINSITKVGEYDTKAEAGRAYESVVSAITGRLSTGGAKSRVIRLPELGTFQMKTRKARKGRNPQTGRTIKIKAKKVVTFRNGKSLAKSL
ncbi:MAG: HU family DNA-binding protein [Candidatus Omnitrophica bacterium]|nr:HU family DNA-binding protein [Candidatus Omnitrophota bacterium]